MIKELSLPYICEVHQRSKFRPKKYRHCCQIDKDIYLTMVEIEALDITEYIISDDVFFVDFFNYVQLWFIQSWRADEFERKVHLWLLGYSPIKRFGEFL
jgi:hypothetical protein